MMVLVTGGASSGKSAVAEQIAQSLGGHMAYLAVMKPYGPEDDKRIARHRMMRSGKGFDTVEQYTDLHLADYDGFDTVLLECMSNLLANEMFSLPERPTDITGKILRAVDKIRISCGNLVIVTNEIFSSGESYEEETEEYIRYLGEINRRLAEQSDAVVEAVVGIPLCIKGDISCLKIL